MKMVAVFHNKGGVGKSTLLFHTASALAEQGHKILMMDLDPQSNLSLYGLSEIELQNILYRLFRNILMITILKHT